SSAQLHYWKSDLALWSHTLDVCGPSTFAHSHLGVALLRLERFVEAEQHFREALRLAPNNRYALHNLGTALVGQGKLPAAVEQYRLVVHKYPEWDRPHYHLGLALADLGQRQEAIAEQAEALRLNPD